jgi:hypothetical protein
LVVEGFAEVVEGEADVVALFVEDAHVMAHCGWMDGACYRGRC